MLVMATLKLGRARRGEERQLRFDVGKLRNPDVEKALKLGLQKKKEERLDLIGHMRNYWNKKLQCSKEQLQTKYSELDRGLKTNARADKKALTEKLADDAEEAAQKQDMATMYKITKSLAGGFKTMMFQ